MKSKLIKIIIFLMALFIYANIVYANPLIDKTNDIANGSDEIFDEGLDLINFSYTHTHQYLTARGLLILTNDKGYNFSKPFYDYCDILLKASDLPDKDESSGRTYMHHFYNPYNDTGLFNTKVTAKTKLMEHALKALELYKNNKESSIEELGRALHYLEDINQPFHVGNLTSLNSNHYSFEKWVDKNRTSFKATTNDQYNLYKNLTFEEYLNQLTYDCAINSYSYISLLKDKKNFFNACSELLPYTQRQVANLLDKFLKEANKNS